MRKYTNYKKTNIDWLENIPNEWEQYPLFAFIKQVSRKGFSDKELLSVYRDYGVIIKSSRDDNHNKPGEDLNNYKLVEKGDLVLNKMKTWQGSLGVSQYEGIVSPAYITCKVASNIDSEFLHYLLRSSGYINYYNRLSYGIRVDQWDMHFADFKRVPIFLPNITEQKNIVNQVKKVDTHIKLFIEQKLQYINLLKEYKQSKINELVTKGLNPNVKMKDSGIEWLGRIPAHWERFKLKHIGTAQIGITYSPNDIVDQNEGILVLRSSNIQNGKLALNDNVYIRSSFEINDRQLVRDGDILICSRNGSPQLVGKNIPINKEIEGNTFGAFMTIFRSKYNSYLRYYFNSDFFKSQMGLFSTTTINQLTNSILNNLVTIMPQDEQETRNMISAISKIEEKFEMLIEKAEKQIEIIQQYRQSLIYELVTGKRKP
ncbi:restriction endonuclease subunit S [Candidatus Dojkabacteria bacterium]|nr:restriction endonuclease subunit S [Candidatus Dojkabacteria bacterium]